MNLRRRGALLREGRKIAGESCTVRHTGRQPGQALARVVLFVNDTLVPPLDKLFLPFPLPVLGQTRGAGGKREGTSGYRREVWRKLSKLASLT